MHAAGKMKRSPSPPVVERPGSEPLAPVDGRKGAAGLVWAVEGAEPRVGQNRVKKQLRVGSWAPRERAEPRDANRVVGPLIAPCMARDGSVAATLRFAFARAGKPRALPV